jgi:hypothetical protein
MDNEKPGPTTPEVPPGFVLVPKGGRPRKESRDAAIFAAYQYFLVINGGHKTKAKLQVRDHFEAQGTAASVGIGDERHVSSALKRAERRGLVLCQTWATAAGLVWITERVLMPNGPSMNVGARAWVWWCGEATAHEWRVSKISPC